MIEANRRYERSGVRFAVVDAIRGPIPEADFALCREMLFHLSFAHGRAVIDNVKRSARLSRRHDRPGSVVQQRHPHGGIPADPPPAAALCTPATGVFDRRCGPR
jgi:hypothetical protein